MEGMDWMNFIQLVAIPAFGWLAFQINKISDRVETRLNKHSEKTTEDLDTVRKGVGDWQLEVVRGYATKSELERLESRIVGAIERLESKLDKQFEAIALHNDRTVR